MPIGIDAERWVTRAGCRSVLAVVHTVTSGQRLLEVVELIERDRRVQVVFTQAPDVFGNGVSDFLRSTEGVVLPWEQAIRERFDLALAASYGGLHQLHAPLVVLPHGAGYGKSHAADGTRVVYGLDAQRLTHNGKVLASALVLSHEDQLDVLRGQCPAAVDRAVVAGDPCYDRMIASLPHRQAYRTAFGVEPDARLLVVSSTWGGDSLFATHPDLLLDLVAELVPLGWTTAALLHPAIWSGHGKRQVKAWLADCRTAGLVLVDPAADWRAAVVAADQVIADHGSVGVYAAAIGRPLLLTEPPPDAPTTGSAHDLVRAKAPRLVTGVPFEEQFHADTRWTSDVAAALTSRQGMFSAELRRAVYRLLKIPEPGSPPPVEPVPVPVRDGW
ncbi:hypothetical protein [Umezawaea sp. Da 62-37]|uniref:hypothetical protein n=1 Tax=Umezawaea sp. Da 62-37 TaxID=3075927 RepID=UPI0028F71C28|nr:hypothetical protein [Umezawaea sp. Da 62-37]WNV82810.1 hypothetical protein RM788_32025 [Umezawaea sp. Da 62-37]